MKGTTFTMPHENTSSCTFDIETLEYDEAPVFILEVGTAALQFDILYANKVFRNEKIKDTVQVDRQEAIRFRAWVQALGQPDDSRHEFAGYVWSSNVAKKSGEVLKAVRGTPDQGSPKVQSHDQGATAEEGNENHGPIHKYPKRRDSSISDGDIPAMLRNVPRTNFNARWEGIQTMLEMSDVGVFECSMNGTLMYANDAWYRLRLVSLVHAQPA
jgi:hypothetical protein